MKYILGGHWTTPPEGWTVLTEQEQDMTKRLQWDDNSVDAIFSEHAAMEHLSFIDGVGFLKEAYRVIRPGGFIRIVCPFTDSLCDFADGDDEIGRNFIKNQVAHYYPEEFELLRSMGIDPLSNAKAFFLDSLFKRHNHKFIWDYDVLKKVIIQIGFEWSPVIYVGESQLLEFNECPERKIRGLNLDELTEKYSSNIFDMESMVLEAIK